MNKLKRGEAREVLNWRVMAAACILLGLLVAGLIAQQPGLGFDDAAPAATQAAAEPQAAETRQSWTLKTPAQVDKPQYGNLTSATSIKTEPDFKPKS